MCKLEIEIVDVNGEVVDRRTVDDPRVRYCEEYNLLAKGGTFARIPEFSGCSACVPQAEDSE